MQKQFDVDVDRKKWVLETQPRSLVHSALVHANSTNTKPKQEPLAEIENPKASVLTVAHALTMAFSSATPSKPAAIPEKAEAVAVQNNETRLSTLVYFYLLFIFEAASVTPAVLNYGMLTPYYALCAVLPLGITALAFHIMIARAQNKQAAVICGLFFIAMCLPASSLLIGDLVIERRWVLHILLGVLETFYCLTLSGEVYIVGLLCFTIVLLPVAGVEIAPKPNELWLMVAIYWNMACSTILALWSALQYSNEKVVFSFSRVN